MPREGGASSKRPAGGKIAVSNAGWRLLDRPPLRAMTMKKHRDGTTWAAILVPYAWLVVFFLLPFLIVLKISFSLTAIAQPPYVPVFDPAAGWQGVKEFLAALTLDNYAAVFTDSLYAWSYWKS